MDNQFDNKFIVKIFDKITLFTEYSVADINPYICKELDRHYDKFVYFELVETMFYHEVEIITYIDGKSYSIGYIKGDMELLEAYNWSIYVYENG